MDPGMMAMLWAANLGDEITVFVFNQLFINYSQFGV